MSSDPSPADDQVLFESTDESVRSWATDSFEAAIISVRDPQKECNEDAALAMDLGPAGVVMAVVDGMGGMNNGRAAARAAVDALASTLRARSSEQSLRGAVVDGLEHAQQAVLDASPGGGATVAVAVLSGNRLQAVHAGDSEVLVFGQRGRIKLRTTPHSPVGYAVEAGLIHEDDALDHPERHLVSNGLGLEGMRIDVGPRVALRRFDTVVLATDGLTDNAFVHEVVEALRSGPLVDQTAALVAMCRGRMAAALAGTLQIDEPGKPDDLTMIVVRRTH